MTGKADTRPQWGIVGSGLQIGPENLSCARQASPGNAGQRERDAIPTSERFRLEGGEISLEHPVADDFGEIPQRRTHGSYEVHSARPLEQRLWIRRVGTVEDSVHVDEPLTGLNGRGPSSGGAGEEEFVSRVEHTRRPFDLAELDRPFAKHVQPALA